MEYGLIGGRLGHSYSKPIHEALGGYPYELKELPDEAAVRAFFSARCLRRRRPTRSCARGILRRSTSRSLIRSL